MGLVTGVGLALLGHEVMCVDVNSTRVEELENGNSPIQEEGLEPVLAELLQRGKIRFTTSIETGIEQAEIVFIAVATPSLPDGGTDSSHAVTVARDLARLIHRYTVVAVKSTMPVETLDQLDSVLKERLIPGKQFDLVSNPEFLREGRGLRDFFRPDRIVVGSDSEPAFSVMRQVYQPLIDGSAELPEAFRTDTPIPYLETTPSTAQMIKYASNAFLATRISFINEIAGLCQRLNADVGAVVEGLGLDPRIGKAYLQPGIGFGGPCLEKDLTALVRLAQDNNYDPVLLDSVLQRNHLQLIEVQNKLINGMGPSPVGKTVAVLGLAFKEGTNDVRNSLALRLMKDLADSGATVHGHDPLAIPEAEEQFQDATYFENVYEALAGVDAAVVLNSVAEYRDLDLERVAATMKDGLLVDVRGVLNSGDVLSHGLRYDSIG